LTTGWHLP